MYSRHLAEAVYGKKQAVDSDDSDIETTGPILKQIVGDLPTLQAPAPPRTAADCLSRLPLSGSSPLCWYILPQVAGFCNVIRC